MTGRSGTTPDGFRWRLAPCLVVLEDEINARYPKRSKVSDGSIASAAHSKQNPTSDHEADRGDGLVKALDLTDDPPRFDPDDFFDEVIARRDPRVKYVIKDGRIWRSYRTSDRHPAAWTPEPYRGSNPHTSHAHLSVTDAGASDTSTWFPSSRPKPTPAPQEDDVSIEWSTRMTMRELLGRGPKDQAELDFHMGECARLGDAGYLRWLEVQKEAQAWAKRIGAEVRTPDSV